MPTSTQVSVAVLSWNGRQHLEICLEALKGQQDPKIDWEVLVLDNGSKDGTAAWVREHHPWVRLIESSHNLGFCGGNNRLVDEATGDAVVLLNNDTRPQPQWLGALVDAYRSAPEDVAAVSGCIVDWEGDRLDFGRGVMAFDGHAFQLDFRRPLASARVPAADEELAFPCGGNMMIRRSSFLEAGGFDEDYFAYLEDVDLGWRLWAGGERVIFAPQAIVHHRSGATSDLLGLYNRGFLFERNAFLTVYKNCQDGLWQRLLPAVWTTFMHRTQTLLVQSNPGAATLTLDPYAGWIADTSPVRQPTGLSASPEGVESPGGALSASSGSLASSIVPPPPSPSPSLSPLSPPPLPEGSDLSLSRRAMESLRQEGLGGFLRRAAAAAKRRMPRPGGRDQTRISDDRTIAQFRVATWLLGHLDTAAEKRLVLGARRRRSDDEIFERFPPWIVPTYPGDERLFASPGFEALLPPELRFVRAELADVMALDPPETR